MLRRENTQIKVVDFAIALNMIAIMVMPKVPKRTRDNFMSLHELQMTAMMISDSRLHHSAKPILNTKRGGRSTWVVFTTCLWSLF